MRAKSGRTLSGDALALTGLAVVLLVVVAEPLSKALSARPAPPNPRLQEPPKDWKPAFDYGEAPPPFRLPDARGKLWSLEDFRGKPTCLTLYDDDPRCLTFARELEKIRAHIGGGKLHMVSIVGFSAEEAKSFAGATGDRSVFLFDSQPAQPVRAQFAAGRGPALWVFRRNGTVHYPMPPIEGPVVPERELAETYRALRSLIPLPSLLQEVPERTYPYR